MLGFPSQVLENSGFSHGKMVDLSNMFHSYVSLPEDNIMISIDQWDFQDPIDGGTLASTIFQAKKKLWGHSLKFRPFKKGLIYGIGTSNQSVPEIPIDCAIRTRRGLTTRSCRFISKCRACEMPVGKLTIFWGWKNDDCAVDTLVVLAMQTRNGVGEL